MDEEPTMFSVPTMDERCPECRGWLTELPDLHCEACDLAFKKTLFQLAFAAALGIGGLVAIYTLLTHA